MSEIKKYALSDPCTPKSKTTCVGPILTDQDGLSSVAASTDKSPLFAQSISLLFEVKYSHYVGLSFQAPPHFAEMFSCCWPERLALP